MLNYEATDHLTVGEGGDSDQAITENHWDNIISKAREKAKNELELRK